MWGEMEDKCIMGNRMAGAAGSTMTTTPAVSWMVRVLDLDMKGPAHQDACEKLRKVAPPGCNFFHTIRTDESGEAATSSLVAIASELHAFFLAVVGRSYRH